jgi:hypothetical protein
VLALGGATAAQPEGSECSKRFPNVAPDVTTGPLAFGPRAGDRRCEGFFIAPVAGEPMALVRISLGAVPPEAEEVVLSSVLSRDIRVRAVALPEATFYRMEGEIQTGKTFRWPLREVVRASTGLKPSDLGVYGWFERDGEIIYTPVKISSAGGPIAAGAQATVVVRANVAFDEILYQLSDRSDCRPAGKTWLSAGQYVRSGGLVSLVAGAHTTCLLLRGRTENSDAWRHLTVRLALG